LALSAESSARRYTYADLASFPDDHLRREIIDGELIVTPSPIVRHQQAVMNIAFHLESYRRTTGGRALVAPMDVFFADDNVVEPDVLFIRAEHSERVEKKFIRAAPDVVVEVSSPPQPAGSSWSVSESSTSVSGFPSTGSWTWRPNELRSTSLPRGRTRPRS